MSTFTKLSILSSLGVAVHALPASMYLRNITAPTNTTGSLPPTIVDYSQFGISQYIPYTNQSNVAWTNTNSIELNINGIPVIATIDTGSTGIVLSKAFMPKDTSQCSKGHIYYSSSHWLQEGLWCPSNVTIGTGFVSSVNVLVKTNERCCPQFNAATDDHRCQQTVNSCVCRKTCDQPKSKRASQTTERAAVESAYMGIGFGRAGEPSQNIFWNVVSINGTNVNETSYRQGYVVEERGITLGLTAADTAGFASTKMTLVPGTNDTRNWQEAPMSVSVNNGTWNDGLILIDSGISNAYLTAGAKWSNGSHITVRFPSDENPIAEWTFDINPTADVAAQNLLTPSITTGDGARVELNTGRHLFNGFDVLVDPVGGYYGLRRKESAGEFGRQFIPAITAQRFQTTSR